MTAMLILSRPPLVVGFKFLVYKKGIDKYYWKITENYDDYLILISIFNFNVPCLTSPRCCTRGSPGGWI